jgi:hypothetical protein
MPAVHLPQLISRPIHNPRTTPDGACWGVGPDEGGNETTWTLALPS